MLTWSEYKKIFIENKDEYIIYPYQFVNDKTVPIAEKDLKKNSNLYSYLLSQKKNLKGREYFEKSSKLWYELWNQRKISNFDCDKIVVAELSESNRFALSSKNEYYGDTVCGIIPTKNTVGLKFLLAILNSTLMEFFYKKVTVPKANKYYIYKNMYLKNIPIVSSPIDNPTLQKPLITLVDKILAAKGKDPLADTSKWEAEIDARVFHLYGLTEEEMLTVLNSFPKMSIVEKTQIQNFYRDLERGNLK